MAKPIPHHRRSERATMPTFSATDAKNEFGRVLDTALEKGAVVITRHDAPKAVLLALHRDDVLGSVRSVPAGTERLMRSGVS